MASQESPMWYARSSPHPAILVKSLAANIIMTHDQHHTAELTA